MNNALFLGAGKKILTGEIFSNDSNYPSPYVGSTMRATAGELAFNDSNLDRVELDDNFSIPDGGYLEYRAKHDFFNTDYNHFHNSSNDSYIGIGSGDFRMFESVNSQTVQWQLSMSLGVYYTHRVERAGNDYEYFRNGISQGTRPITTSEIVINIIGNKSNGSRKFRGSIDYIDLNGSIFNFNETGDGTTVKTG